MYKAAAYYARMAWHFGRFVLTPPIADPEGAVRANLLRREENFLGLVRRGVFENPRSPYSHLFRHAGCTHGDLSRLVRSDGLEGTLGRLREAGVYLTHAELKGGPVRRGGLEIPNDAAATGNPAAGAGIETVSSGSRSGGTATSSSNEYRRHRECYEVLARKELAREGTACAFLRPFLPHPGALIGMAGWAAAGVPAERWFATGKVQSGNSQAYVAATRFLVAEARLAGRRIPFPTFLAPDDFLTPARWIADNKSQGRTTFLRAGVSAAARVCAAAIDAGLDVSGTSILAGGEALSPARQRVFDAAGATAHGRYAISEIGTVGIGCRQMKGNSVHLFGDAVAVIGHRRPAPYVGAEVNSLLFTSVHPDASRILINAEMEDAAIVAPATCECAFSRLGFNTVLRDIYSFGKLSGHGITLAGDVLLGILEEQLPARFGGRPGDYQLVETEGASQLELRLRISPRTKPSNPDEVRLFFLEQVRRVYGGELSARTWETTRSIQTEIAEPHATRTGKVHALHLTAFGGKE